MNWYPQIDIQGISIFEPFSSISRRDLSTVFRNSNSRCLIMAVFYLYPCGIG